MAKRVAPSTQPPAKQLEGFFARFTPEIAKLARAIVKKMRLRIPGATEMVYDNYNALVIGFCADDRASNVINSIAVYPRWVNLFFFEGDTLNDPDKLLQGTGNVVRHIRLLDAGDLDKPAVKALMAQALANADPPLDPSARRKTIIKLATEKQRPRRPRA